MTPTLEAHCSVRNPFTGRDTEADDVQTPAVPGDKLVRRLMTIYHRQHPAGCTQPSDDNKTVFDSALARLQAPSPAQIGRVYREVVARHAGDQSPGLFLTALLRRAYSVGHRSFVIPTREPHDMLAQYFRPAERVRLHVVGDVGIYCAPHKNCDVSIDGDAGEFFGIGSENCVYTIHGDVKSIGYATGTTFTIHGDVWDKLGLGDDCTYEFHGAFPELDLFDFYDRCGKNIIRVPTERLEQARKYCSLHAKAKVEAL